MADRTPEYHEKALLPTDRVLWTDLGGNLYILGLAPGSVTTEAAPTTVMPDTVIDGTPATVDSTSHVATGYGALRVYIYVLSIGAPTDVRVLPQFSPNNGVNWFDFEEGLWASLFWEDTDTAAGIRKVYQLPLAGEDLVRFRVITTGAGPGATFTVSIRVRGVRGSIPVAHA